MLWFFNSTHPTEIRADVKYIFLFVDATERRKAIELLQDCKEQVILPHLGEKGLEVEISGLEIMNDDQVHANLAVVELWSNYLIGASKPITVKKVEHIRIAEANLLDPIKMIEIWLEYDQKNFTTTNIIFWFWPKFMTPTNINFTPKKYVGAVSLDRSQPCFAPLQEKNIGHGDAWIFYL